MNNLTYISYLENFSLFLESNYLSPKAQLLYMRILMVFNKVNFPKSIQLSNYKLMDMLSCSMGSVSKAREELISAGFIKYESGQKGKPCKYYIYSKGEICYNSDEQIDNTVHEEKKEKQKATRKNKEPETEIKPEEWGFDEELTNTFSSWLQYKKERNEKYKPTGMKMLISEIRNKLNDYTEKEICDLIKQCMAKNWKGIIWDLLPEKKKELNWDEIYKITPDMMTFQA